MDTLEEPKELPIPSCPFCGNPGEAIERAGGWTAGCSWNPMKEALGAAAPCPLEGPMTDLFPTKEEAIKKWSTRAYPKVDNPDVCLWKYVYDEYGDRWETNCGEAFIFEIATPKEHGYNYCPKCGRPMEQSQDG
jgi:ssDNA-binding Zn-finger/Zn-ribbon topoisomerase 1